MSPSRVRNGCFCRVFRSQRCCRFQRRHCAVSCARKSSPCSAWRGCEREKVRPAHPKWPKISVFWRAGRTFSRKCRWRGCVGRVLLRCCGLVCSWRHAGVVKAADLEGVPKFACNSLRASCRFVLVRDAVSLVFWNCMRNWGRARYWGGRWCAGCAPAKSIRGARWKREWGHAPAARSGAHRSVSRAPVHI